MIPFGVTLDKVKFFFHEETILKPAERMTQSLLRSFGAYHRANQRNLLKRAVPDHRRSRPGNPPLRHITDPDIKETVFFFVDTKAKLVVSGMVLLRSKSPGRQPMPGALEYFGGTFQKKSGKGMVRQRSFEPRPSAVPAYEKAVKVKLPALIAGGIMREV